MLSLATDTSLKSVEEVGLDPNDIILGGDSAGASVAIALADYLALNQFPT